MCQGVCHEYQDEYQDQYQEQRFFLSHDVYFLSPISDVVDRRNNDTLFVSLSPTHVHTPALSLCLSVWYRKLRMAYVCVRECVSVCMGDRCRVGSGNIEQK